MKKFLRWMTFVLVAVSVTWVLAADFSVRIYKPSAAETACKAAMDTTSVYSQQKVIAREYQAKFPGDMGVQLRVVNCLAASDLDSVRDFYRLRAEREPNNDVAVFVAGKLADSPMDARRYANQLLKRDPDNYWGNLLLASSYSSNPDSGSINAEAALRKAIARDNSLPYAVEALGNLLARRGDKQAADAVFVKLAEMLPGDFAPVIYRIRLAGDQTQAVKRADEFLARNPNNLDALQTKAQAQRELSDWKGHLETMRKLVSVSRTGERAYDLGCGFSHAGEKDSAFAWLSTAVDLGSTDIEQYKKDEDLVPLRDDPRWSDLLIKVQSAKNASLAAMMKQVMTTTPPPQSPSPRRSEEVPPQRMNVTAPDFTLKDLNSKNISLSSLRGKVVVLDFWATWCPPCRMSMPLLDKFYTGSKPKNVIVYGVNVFEHTAPSPDGLKAFLTQQNVHFPVLLGTQDVASAYGVSSIPNLVVIDKQGKIAYRHVGYDARLVNILTAQIKELLK